VWVNVITAPPELNRTLWETIRTACADVGRRISPDVLIIRASYRPAIPEGKASPGAELILTPPVTPEPILIDEGLVEGLLGEYKSHFPKATVSKED